MKQFKAEISAELMTEIAWGKTRVPQMERDAFFRFIVAAGVEALRVAHNNGEPFSAPPAAEVPADQMRLAQILGATWTVPQVAKLVGVSEATIYQATRDGRLKRVPNLGGSVRFKPVVVADTFDLDLMICAMILSEEPDAGKAPKLGL